VQKTIAGITDQRAGEDGLWAANTAVLLKSPLGWVGYLLLGWIADDNLFQLSDKISGRKFVDNGRFRDSVEGGHGAADAGHIMTAEHGGRFRPAGQDLLYGHVGDRSMVSHPSNPTSSK
jgi:hypothetical protein